MKEQKLRKFKIINRYGFINNHECNEELLKAHFVEGIVESHIDEYGNLLVNGWPIIAPEEFKFFEEVFDVTTDLLRWWYYYRLHRGMGRPYGEGLFSYKFRRIRILRRSV